MAHEAQDGYPAQEPRTAQPSVATLLRHMAEETERLVRSEVAVVKLELEENTRAIILDAIKTTVYSGIALLGLVSLLAFLVIGLAAVIAGRTGPLTAFWTSALIVGVVFTAAGGFMALRHARQMGKTPAHGRADATARPRLRYHREGGRGFHV